MAAIKTSELRLKSGNSATTWINVTVGESKARTVTRITLKEIEGDSVVLVIEQDAQNVEVIDAPA